MADIRINKLIRKYNIGLQELVDFLQKLGAQVDANPNAKVSDEYVPELDKHFSKDLAMKEASEKIDIKLNEILEKTSRKQQEKAEEEDEEPEMETIIKSTILTGIKRPEPAPKPAPKPEPVPEPEPEPAPAPAPAPEPEPEPEPVPAPVPEPEPAPEPETAPVEEPEPSAPAVAEPVSEDKPEEPAPTPAEPSGESAGEPAGEKAEEPAAAAGGVGLKVLGKIDMSQFEKKKSGKKRERISKSTQKVDVGKVGSDPELKRGGQKDAQKKAGAQKDAPKAGKGRKRGADRFKPELTEAEQEEMQKQIQKQVKETYARMNEGKKNNFGAKYRKEKRELASQRAQEEMEAEAAEKKVLKVTEFVTVNDLATLMNNTPVVKVIAACMSLGLMVSINQRLDAETLVLVAEEFGYKVEFVTAGLTEEIEGNEVPDSEEDLVPRPPVITVMGHVDHGKTSLLDYIRKSNVIAGEAGGITQHIGAYSVTLEDGRHITFLDTPGHEAFTAMRARGAQMTDLAIIIVAADDAVMPQTVEAINHAQAANVPMVFAINKIDKPGAMPDTIRRQLSEMNILVEDWGGKYQCQEISAKKGLNVDKLLEKVLLETDLLELKANPNKLASGAVIESSLDKGRGYLATILVQNGTLRVGDVILS